MSKIKKIIDLRSILLDGDECVYNDFTLFVFPRLTRREIVSGSSVIMLWLMSRVLRAVRLVSGSGKVASLFLLRSSKVRWTRREKSRGTSIILFLERWRLESRGMVW